MAEIKLNRGIWGWMSKSTRGLFSPLVPGVMKHTREEPLPSLGPITRIRTMKVLEEMLGCLDTWATLRSSDNPSTSGLHIWMFAGEASNTCFILTPELQTWPVVVVAPKVTQEDLELA
ncbi:hypothetical protein lerEdw1_017058 [Lerista edwardsae]|nr:hypothetical protein lerEdw1_017058 [Lerista edwardsae]